MTQQLQQRLHYTLRFASAMCFIGHGAFGIITKPIWCNYFAVFGIAKVTAYQLMPWLGSFDIFCGILLLLYPMRVVPLWLVIWGLITASLRPLSGEPFAELIERAGNFGAPLALLLLSGGFPSIFKGLFKPLQPVEPPANAITLKQITILLEIVVFLLLAGHGWLNIIGKKGLMTQYSNLGFANPQGTGVAIGIFEVIAGIAVLIKPFRPFLIAFFVWKMVSELFYPHWEIFEWIERGGSYGCILALWFALRPEVSLGSLTGTKAKITTDNLTPGK